MDSRKAMAVGMGGIMMMAGLAPAAAQTALPEVVVTAPSPIVPQVPASPPPAQPEPAAAASSAPEPNLPGGRPVIADAFVPVTVITRPDIVSTPAASLGDVMFAQPGITSSTFAPGASRPVIRGLDNARVRVQENGIGAMDVSTLSEDHAVPIDPLATDRYEVIRGPATLRWGPQAIGGVVAASNNRIPGPLTPNGIFFDSRGGLSSVDRGREGAIAVDGRNDRIAVHADYFRRQTEDYRTPRGIQANTWTDSWGMAVGASHYFRDGWAGFAVSHIGSRYGIPGIEAAEHGSHIDLEQTKLMGRGEFRLDTPFLDTVRFWFGASTYRHRELGLGHEHGHDHDDHDHGAGSHVHATFHNRELEGRTEVQHRPIQTALGVMTGAAGIQFGHRNMRAEGEGSALLAPNLTDSVAAYLFEELRVTDTVRLQAAARAGFVRLRGKAAIFPPGFVPDDHDHELDEVARERKFVPVSAAVGVLKDLPFGLTASLNAQYAERAPEALELFAKGQHHASGTFEIGNPDLGKEAAFSIEAGLRRARGDFRFDLTAFHTRYRGFIYKQFTGVMCGEHFDDCGDPDGELKQVVFNQRDATFTGIELAGQYDILPLAGGVLGVDAQYDFVRARFSDGSNVPRIPPQRIGGGIYWRDANWFARVGLLHAFAQRDVAEEETPTAGYNLLKAEVSYTRRFKPSDPLRAFTVGLVGTNLLDDEVRNHVSFKKDEVLLAGRNVRLYATMRW